MTPAERARHIAELRRHIGAPRPEGESWTETTLRACLEEIDALQERIGVNARYRGAKPWTCPNG